MDFVDNFVLRRGTGKKGKSDDRINDEEHGGNEKMMRDMMQLHLGTVEEG